MIRVKDKDASLTFYKDVMGMKLKRTSESPNAGFNLYFLGYGPDAPEQTANGVNPVANSEGLLELTWNYGTEKDADFKYHNGNDEPQGFGHICIAVDDLDAACSRFEEKKVNWKKRLTDGRMKNIAFVLGASLSFCRTKGDQLTVLQIPTVTGSRLCRTRSSRHAVIGNSGRRHPRVMCTSHPTAAQPPMGADHIECGYPHCASYAHHSSVRYDKSCVACSHNMNTEAIIAIVYAHLVFSQSLQSSLHIYVYFSSLSVFSA
jgi:lactoylglutathione lyase